MNKPISREMFEDMFIKLSDKFQNTPETLFENIDLKPEMENGYLSFINNKPIYDTFVQESSIYKKNKILQEFITENFISEIYTNIYDTLLIESDTLDLTFKQSYLTENTEKILGVVYLGNDNHNEIRLNEIFENSDTLIEFTENIGIPNAVSATLGLVKSGGNYLKNTLGTAVTTGFTVTAVAIGGAIAGIFTAGAYFALQLLFSIRTGKMVNVKIEEITGLIGSLLISFGSSNNINTGVGRAKRNIQLFDNLDLNPEITKLLKELEISGKSNKVTKSIGTLDELIKDCVDSSNLIDNKIIDESQKQFFKEKYNPRKTGLLKVIASEFFKESNSDDNISGAIINFRKCLITKLLDLYKFLLIASLSESKDYKRIIKMMDKKYNDPVSMLSFVPEDNKHEADLKGRLVSLMNLRLVYDKLASDLIKGSFKIDQEAGNFFKQKLKMIDREVADYINKNQRRIETLHENFKENQEKYIKGNKKPEKDMKRSFLNI